MAREELLHRRDLQQQTLDALLELTVLLGDDMRQDLERRGLTRSRVEVIWRVHHAGPMTQRALADSLRVSARNVTGLIDGLESTGFVERRPHPADRRATLVTLTAQGAAVAAELVEGSGQLADQLFGDLSERRMRSLHRDLGELVERLRALVEAAD